MLHSILKVIYLIPTTSSTQYSLCHLFYYSHGVELAENVYGSIYHNFVFTSRQY